MTRHIIAAALCLAMAATAHSMPSATEPDTCEAKTVIIPPSIKPGAKIAIISPASAIDSMLLVKALKKIVTLGYEPVVYPHAFGRHYGSYAASDSVRAAELMAAFADSEIDAILCSRGGYGCVRLLPMLDAEVARANPKWLVGFSDISALHAWLTHAGVASIHGPMCGHIATEKIDDESTQYLFRLLSHGLPITYFSDSHPFNNHGTAQGRLVGGNLLVINGLSETQYDILNIGDKEDIILFVEDVGERIYAIERVLMRLQQAGALQKVKGLVVGQFTDYKPDDDFDSMEHMIHHWLEQWGYYGEHSIPIAFDFPTGHVKENYPLPVSARATLQVTDMGARITLEE